MRNAKVEPELAETATVTEPLSDAEIRAAIAAVVVQAEKDPELADDLMIAVEVATRDRVDTGQRIGLEDFMRQEGYDPAAFRP